MFELTAHTAAGTRLVRIAEGLAEDLASRAAVHDRDASFPHASIDALKRAGYLTAPIPAEHGGLGVTSVHDLIVASSRLARADPSVAIGVNMHVIILTSVVRRWRSAVAAGKEPRAAAFAASMDAVSRGGAVIAAAVSELGQDLTRPQTTAARTASGWRIEGRKAFCTMSPAATVLYTAVRFDDDGVERYGYAQVPARAAGVEIHDDWDALGMRASGSHSVTFTGVELPAAALRGGFSTGDADADMHRNLLNGLFHAAAALGIAEAAVSVAIAAVSTRGTPDARARTLIAENVVELGAARATLARSAMMADTADEPASAMFADTQAAKVFITEAAVRIVDRALALSGGAGYHNSHPLARAYRDVRAGGIMHPLGANRAYELLGNVVLGRERVLH